MSIPFCNICVLENVHLDITASEVCQIINYGFKKAPYGLQASAEVFAVFTEPSGVKYALFSWNTGPRFDMLNEERSTWSLFQYKKRAYRYYARPEKDRHRKFFEACVSAPAYLYVEFEREAITFEQLVAKSKELSGLLMVHKVFFHTQDLLSEEVLNILKFSLNASFQSVRDLVKVHFESDENVPLDSHFLQFLSPEDQDKVLRNDNYMHAIRDGIVDVPFNPSENRGATIVESAFKSEVDQMAATHKRLFANELKIVQNLVPYSLLEKCTSGDDASIHNGHYFNPLEVGKSLVGLSVKSAENFGIPGITIANSFLKLHDNIYRTVTLLEGNVSESYIRGNFTSLLVDAFTPWLLDKDQKPNVVLREYDSKVTWWTRSHMQMWDASIHCIDKKTKVRREPVLVVEEKTVGYSPSNIMTSNVPIEKYNTNNADMLKNLRAAKMLLLRRADKDALQVAVLFQGFEYRIFFCSLLSNNVCVATEVCSETLVDEKLKSKPTYQNFYQSILPTHAVHVFLALRRIINQETQKSIYKGTDASKRPIAGDPFPTPLSKSKIKGKQPSRSSGADQLLSEDNLHTGNPSTPSRPSSHAQGNPFTFASRQEFGSNGYTALEEFSQYSKYFYAHLFIGQRKADKRNVFFKILINEDSGSIIRNYIQLGSMCNSVQLLDCFRATKNLVLVFPKWHPLTVQRDELFQFKYLETRTIAKISIAICKFLQHLHSANLAHCDIKPPNILCKKSILDDNQNELEIDDFCVCDFDDVKQIGTMEWRIFGTAGFTHPNVDFMKENGSRQRMFELEILPYLDIYSLGATVNWFLQFVTRDSALEEHQALMIIASRLMEVDEVTPINISATIKEFEAFC